MKSILNTEKGICYLCGIYTPTEEHHIFGGGNRKASERNGFKVDLCRDCHNTPPFGIHHNRQAADRLKAECQAKYEENGTRAEFMALIGKNYL